MKEHKKIIFNLKDKIFQTIDIYLGGVKYKDLNYWTGNRFGFAESKKGWGNYSRKDLNEIIESIKRYEKMNPQIVNKKELEFKVTFLSVRKNPKNPELISQIVKAVNPVTAVEKALTRSRLFAEDVLKTEISRSDNKDVTDINLVEIDKGNYKRKEVLEMSKIITIKDLSNKFGVDSKRIRILARRLGLKPKPTGVEGFGPKKKYEWEKGSEEVQKLVAALKKDAAGAEE